MHLLERQVSGAKRGVPVECWGSHDFCHALTSGTVPRPAECSPAAPSAPRWARRPPWTGPWVVPPVAFRLAKSVAEQLQCGAREKLADAQRRPEQQLFVEAAGSHEKPA